MLPALLALSLSLTPSARAAFPEPERSTAPISIVWPPEGFVLPTTDGAWIMGSVLRPDGLFKVNGTTVTTHKDGAFLAWLPVTPGTFTFAAALQVGTSEFTFARDVFVTPAPTPLPEKPVAIEADSMSPRQDEELRAGDWLLTRARVSMGAKPEYRLGRKGSWQPMREAVPALGVYEGAYLVRPDDELNAAAVEFRAKGRGAANAVAPGKVTITRGTPLVASLRGQAAVMVRTGPGEGDLFPALGGTRFVIGGHKGPDAKVLLSDGQVGWIENKSLEYALPGAHPPRAETETVTVRGGEKEAVVRVGLGDRVPFIVEESDDLNSLTVRLHYTYLHTNWIVYNSADDFVDEVRLKQEGPDVVALTVRLKPGRRLWGYWPTFEGNALRLELRKPPRLAKKGSALTGLRIFIDPGHMPSAPGATGPLGTREMDVNYAIAAELEAIVRKDGGVPLMSRASPADEVSLVDRPKQAVDKKADLFVSVHNNFLPANSNPFRGGPHGYSIFYYHPHSLELARAVQAAYAKLVPLPSEDMRFGDLLVCRLSAVPAILTESAYLTYPEQESMLLDAGFRRKVAEAIADGLREFLKKERERQR